MGWQRIPGHLVGKDKAKHAPAAVDAEQERATWARDAAQLGEPLRQHLPEVAEYAAKTDDRIERTVGQHVQVTYVGDMIGVDHAVEAMLGHFVAGDGELPGRQIDKGRAAAGLRDSYAEAARAAADVGNATHRADVIGKELQVEVIDQAGVGGGVKPFPLPCAVLVVEPGHSFRCIHGGDPLGERGCGACEAPPDSARGKPRISGRRHARERVYSQPAAAKMAV